MSLIVASISNLSSKVTDSPIVIDGSDLLFTPTAFSESIPGFAYTIEENDNETAATYTVYDGNFQFVKNINIPISKINCTKYEQYGYEAPETVEYTVYVEPEPIRAISEYIHDSSNDFYLSYGIFNPSLCYVMPVYEDKEINIVYDGFFKEWGTVPVITGYNIFDESNNIVSTIKIPDGYEGNGLYFVVMNKTKYIICEIHGFNGGSCNAIYRLEDDNSINFIKMTEPKVSPRNPRQGERVTVSIDEKYNSEKLSVSVVSTEGRIVMKDKIRNGQTSLDIDTSHFKQGIYLVKVSGNGKTSEAAKIIVR